MSVDFERAVRGSRPCPRRGTARHRDRRRAQSEGWATERRARGIRWHGCSCGTSRPSGRTASPTLRQRPCGRFRPSSVRGARGPESPRRPICTSCRERVRRQDARWDWGGRAPRPGGRNRRRRPSSAASRYNRYRSADPRPACRRPARRTSASPRPKAVSRCRRRASGWECPSGRRPNLRPAPRHRPCRGIRARARRSPRRQTLHRGAGRPDAPARRHRLPARRAAPPRRSGWPARPRAVPAAAGNRTPCRSCRRSPAPERRRLQKW